MGWPVGYTDHKCRVPAWIDWRSDPADAGHIPRITKRRDGRTSRLKMIGNGQVPLCAAAMWHWGETALQLLTTK